MREHARPVLCPDLRAVFRRLLGFCEGLRASIGVSVMDFIIAGVAALFLFAYLIYALLRPERF